MTRSTSLWAVSVQGSCCDCVNTQLAGFSSVRGPEETPLSIEATAGCYRNVSVPYRPWYTGTIPPGDEKFVVNTSINIFISLLNKHR